MKKTRQPMPEQEAQVRRHNFDEVALGYTPEMAVLEAERCLQCKNPLCVAGCPVGIDIPGFIQKVKLGEFEEAFRIIDAQSSLPAVCGRVCPQESQCEGKCICGVKGEPIAIGRLERFVADTHYAQATEKVAAPTPNGHKVAVIGSGPAGLTCAGELARRGYEVTVFEALHKAGGVLVYGIPEFRLPKRIVEREIEQLRALGVKIEVNTVIGKTYSVEELMKEMGFEAVFIGTGAGLPRFLEIEGENLKGVYSANEFLTRINLMKAYREDSSTPVLHARRVAVVGGGNVAMDAARSALRLGAEKVYIVYRRSLEELPARREEVEHAVQEGVELMLLNNPVKVLGDEGGFVKALRCVRMELGEPDASGRRAPREIPDSEFDLECDSVIIAIGTSPNPLMKNTTKGLEVNRRGGIVVAEQTGKTSLEGVYAGGDAVMGAATVILAMGAGKNAAASIDRFLS
ncbi:MAG: NADPH-dependent glutamate synthase [Clostridia bacterium]|nr:NADPH-dependent glutamate synthase [Clostridia bacterium]